VSASLLPAADSAATLSGRGAMGVVTRLMQIIASAPAERDHDVTPI